MENELLNPLDYADNPAKYEIQRELQRLHIHNEECPEFCFHCGSSNLVSSGGYVGETILSCKDCGEMLWEDSEMAIRRIF